jgi:hypothetical protein
VIPGSGKNGKVATATPSLQVISFGTPRNFNGAAEFRVRGLTPELSRRCEAAVGLNELLGLSIFAPNH